jgi:hypothetical protein
MGGHVAAAVVIIVTYLWGSKFNVADVDKLAAGVKRNLTQPHRFVVITDRNPRDMAHESWSIPEADIPLTEIKGCYARLRLFDPVWQAAHGIAQGQRIALIDLDTVITGPLDPIFDRPEPFVIMQGGNSHNPCNFNGALQMLRAGAHPDVWGDFNLEAASRVPFYEFPDDQGWIWAKLPDAAGWKCGVESGVFVYHKPGWPGWDDIRNSTRKDRLPAGARLVTFSGWRNPQRFEHLDWVKSNWR